MDLFNLFARISIDSSEYESGVKSAKSSNEGLKKSTAALGTDFTALQNKIKVLSAQHESASKKVADLKEQFNKSAAETGVTSKKTQELADELDAAEKEANDLKSKLDSLTSTTEDTGNKFSGLGGKITSGLASAGKLAAGGIGVIAGAATAAVGGLLALESATEEYRVAQGKLNTAFESAGYSIETARGVYRDFFKILGDTDTATEASQLLAKLSMSAEDMSTWTDIAAGVWGTFGDSLPIEGLIEASNETAKVGTVTGVLADALNWAGINEDDFNEALANCTDEADRNQLIMETLSGTYDEASDAFYRNNDALVASREAQAKMDESLAKLGDSVSKVKTRLMGEMLPGLSAVAEGFANMLSGVDGADTQFSIAVSGMIQTGVQKLPEFLDFGVKILTSVLNGIVQSIPSLVAAVPQVINSFIEAGKSLFPSIIQFGSDILTRVSEGAVNGIPTLVEKVPHVVEDFFSAVNSNFPAIIEKGSEILSNLASGIGQAIPKLIPVATDLIAQTASFIANNLPLIINAGVDIILSLIGGILKSIPSLVAQMPTVILNIVSALLSGIPLMVNSGVQVVTAIKDGMFSAVGWLYESASSIGSNIVNGVWRGIQGSAATFTRNVKNFFGGIVNGVKNFLGIRSKSRVFAGIGGYMAEGLNVGWNDEYSNVKKNIENGLDFESGKIGITTKVTGSGRSGITGGVSYGTVNFTINAKDGQSAKEIAKEVAILMEIDRERAANAFA